MKRTIIQTMGAVLGLVLSSSIFAVGGTTVDVRAKVGVVTCLRGNCSQVINAIGEKKVLDTSKLQVTDLGTFSERKEGVELSLPTRVGQMEVYSFTPTLGDNANKKIIVAFDNQAPRVGSLYGGKELVKVYRNVEGEKEWMEAGAFNGKPIPAKWGFDVEPNGDFITFSPMTERVMTFELGAAGVTKK
jgi:hypothetical protein